ncbi:MAG: C45 family autoproteolytic acyltransferase/hydrolase [Thermodesulfobacteriota bacterium]
MSERESTTFPGNGTAKSSVLPPSIIPVVFLSGSDYEMGFQYGRQAAQYIEMLKYASWVEVLQEQDREGVLNSLRRLRHYIDNDTPEAIEQIRGIVDGCKATGFEISFDDVMVINCVPKKMPQHGPSGDKKEEPPLEECSVFAAWGSATKDGRLVFGDSKDSVFNHQVVIVAFPGKGNHYMTGVRAGELSEHFAMSNRGLFIGTGKNPCKREVDLGYGLPKPFFIQHMLRFAQDATEAKDLFLSREFPSPTNFIIADVKGRAYVVERTAVLKPVRKPGDHGEIDFIYSTNTAMTDEMKAGVKSKEYVEHAGWKIPGSAIPRSLEIWNMCHNYHGKIDVEFVKMMWRFNGDPHPYSLKKEEFKIERDEKIGLRENMRVAVGVPDDGDEGFVHVCTGPAGRILHPPTLRHRDCFQAGGTHSFYRLTLASDPEKITAAAKNDAHDALAGAYHEFMMLKYSDPGYDFLNGLSSLATAEYYEGVHAYQRGVLSEGNEALLRFAQAATAFTRSQAHARQLYHSLVPPATKPEDLGLKPYSSE